MFTTCEFFAGWFSGVCGLLVGHPLDTVKVRQQTFRSKSMKQIVLKTLKSEGIRGFYRGLQFPLLAAGLYNSLFFGVYGNFLRHLVLKHSGMERSFCCEKPVSYPGWHIDVFQAGCVGGLATVTVGCPIELVKTQLQVQTGSKKKARGGCFGSPWSCIAYIFRTGGLRGVYRGAVPMLYRDVPAFGVYILTFEHLVCWLQGEVDSADELSTGNQIAAGGAAGIASWVFVMPFDVVKSRMQSDDILKPKFKGMIDCFLKSYKADGLGIFMRGFWVSSMRAFPTNAVTFVSYEWFLNHCHKIGPRS